MDALVVEDDDVTRHLISKLLEKRGCQVVACPDAESGWEAFAARPFPFVVIDWGLPGMDGLELCRHIRSSPEGERSVILVVTARDFPDDLQLVLNAGADDYLTKPVDATLLNIRVAIAERQVTALAERRRAETALGESIDRFDLAMRGTSDGFWVCTFREGQVNDPANPLWGTAQMWRLLGYQPGELPGQLSTWHELLHPDDREQTFRALLEHTRSGAPYDVEYRLLTRERVYRWFSARGQASWDQEGRPIRMAGSIRDITPKRAVEEALRESEQRYRLIAERVSDVIWTATVGSGHLPNDPQSSETLGPEGVQLQFTYFSPSVERVLGYTPEEAAGLRISQLLTPDSYQLALAALLEELAVDASSPDPMRSRTLELEHVCKSGEVRWCEVTSTFLRDAKGRPLGVLGVSRDIMERKVVENALRASEEKWRSLVENAPDLIMSVDRDARLVFMNRVVDGHDLENVIGTCALDYATPAFRTDLSEAIERAFLEGKSSSLEILADGASGKLAWYSSRVGPIRHNGQVVQAIIIATDVTHRKEADMALAKEQNLLKQLLEVHERERQLIAYEIHDGLVQEMTGALMHFEAFSSAGPGQKNPRRSDLETGLQLLRSGVVEARRLISGLRPPILDEAGVVAAIEYLVNETRPDIPDLDFMHNTRFERLLPPLENAIFRVVQEALNNIRRHSGSRRALVSLIEQNGNLQLEIRDWGSGFDLDAIRGKHFGLQGIRERARLLDGRAQIESAPGLGTLVRVEFPLLAETAEAPLIPVTMSV